MAKLQTELFGPVVLARKPAAVLISKRVSPKKKRTTMVVKNAPTISNSPDAIATRLAFARKAHGQAGVKGTEDGLNAAARVIQDEGLRTAEEKLATIARREAARKARVARTATKIEVGTEAFRL